MPPDCRCKSRAFVKGREREASLEAKRAEAAEHKASQSASASDELAQVTAERDKLQKDAAAAEEKTSKLEAELREARDAQTNTSELEAELKEARDRIATLESAPTGDAETDDLRQKVAQLETKVAANDKAMAEAGKRFKQLKEKAKRRVEEESAKLVKTLREDDRFQALGARL